jgi:hypothetical protein
MSEPVAKGEIEDVIASIRRLVSAAPDAHRLILTEAQRIDRPPPAAPDPARRGDAPAQAVGSDDPSADEDLNLERAVAELEAELEVASLPEGGLVPGEERYDPWEPVEAAGQAGASAMERIDVEIEAELQAEAEIVMFRRASEGGVHIVRTSARPSAAAEAPEGQGAEAALAVEPGPVSTEAAPAARGEPVQAARVAARAAELENIAADDAAENVARPDLDSLLDERDLRALVAEVLREELKGPLGERITRNVRKLVRREIAQVLSSYDLG